jgi:molybdenum cofactor biosynthesis protein MoaF
MRIPMHRFKYTKLTKEQIGTKLKPAEGGPKSASAFTNVLNGKTLKIVTQDGPTLEYKFGANRRLTLTEGDKQMSAGYGELTLNQMVFFSHLIPGEQKGYNVFIDQKTNLATVFEVWTSSGIKQNAGRPNEFTLDDREVQRQIYFGYVDSGQKAPEKLHHYTNRMTGKGIHWTQDTGIETLELYASVANTNFIELTRHIDDLSYVATSDYVLVDDRTIIYNRTECEFSGIHTCFVADLYGVKQVGVRFGFNDKDELEYYMFRGDGKVVGQLAYLENFDDHGLRPMFAPAPARAPAGGPTPAAAPLAAPAPQKGARTTYRPVRTFTHMTDEEVHQAALQRTSAFGAGAAQQAPPQAQATGNNLPFSDILVGKEFTLRFDNGGPVRDYRIKEMFKLQYRDHSDNAWHDADYRAYEGDDNLAWFSHMIADSKPRASVQVAVDFTNGLATSIESRMGTPYYGNETSYRAIFGVAEMPGLEAPLYVRHELTDELVGHAFSWSYSDQTTSMHVYSSPHSMSWVIFTGAQALGAEWSSPCIYVKLRPGVYIFCQNEEACNGAQMVELLNTKASHDCGFTYNGGARGVSLGVTGAIGRHIGKFDITALYGPKRRNA